MDASEINPTAQIPVPAADESFERYCVRAHLASLAAIPDPDQRNEMVWGAWNQSRGQRPEEAVALSKFSADRFSRSNGHCVFAEHETVAADGSPRKYGLGELAKIVRQHSKEQRDIGAFPALTSHHTPDKTDPNGKDPDVLGYSGNQRLGMIGRENPRWAIFADEFHLPGANVELSKKPYRSVELWTFKDGRMRFHPVAAVGAEAPRLQMPAKYSGKFELLEHEGATVEKYTVAAFAGGSNTFVKKPVKFTEDQNMNDQESAKLLAMLQETPQFKFLTRLMEEYEAEQSAAPQPDAGMGAPAPAGPAGPPMADAPPAAPPPAPVAAPGDDLADLQDLLGPESDAPKPDAPPPADKPPEKNTVANSNPNVVSLEKYNALHGVLSKQGERLIALERIATDATRRQKLSEMASKFPMVVDFDEEAKACLYSLGAQMSDEQFNAHVGTVEKYAQRMADSPMVPRGEMPERYVAQTQVEKYEQRLAEEAIKVHGENLKAGKVLDYSLCEAEAKKRLGAK